MASEKVAAERFTCDGCGKSCLLEEDDIPPGYHGRVYEIAEWGGGLEVFWFACKAACIKNAVLTVLKREREQS